MVLCDITLGPTICVGLSELHTDVCRAAATPVHTRMQSPAHPTILSASLATGSHNISHINAAITFTKPSVNRYVH